MSDFKRIGSIDICMKCAIAHGDGRNCKCAPEDRVFFDFPIIRGLAPNQEHVYCTDCGELLTQRHQCKTPRGGFEFL